MSQKSPANIVPGAVPIPRLIPAPVPELVAWNCTLPVKVGALIGAAPNEVGAAGAVMAPVPPWVTATGTEMFRVTEPVVPPPVRPVPAATSVIVPEPPPVEIVVGVQADPLHPELDRWSAAVAETERPCSCVTVAVIVVVPEPETSPFRVIDWLAVR